MLISSNIDPEDMAFCVEAKTHRDSDGRIICTRDFLVAECERGHLCRYYFGQLMHADTIVKCPECMHASMPWRQHIHVAQIHKMFEAVFSVPFTRVDKHTWSSPNGSVKFRINSHICKCETSPSGIILSTGKLHAAAAQTFVRKASAEFMKERGLIVAAQQIKQPKKYTAELIPRFVSKTQITDAFDGEVYKHGRQIIRDCAWF